MTVAQRLYLLTTAALPGLAGITGLGLVQMDRVYEATNFTNVNVVPSLLALSRAAPAAGARRAGTAHGRAARHRRRRARPVRARVHRRPARPRAAGGRAARAGRL